MALFFKVLGLLLVVCTVTYVCLLLYIRAARRERLEERWHEDGIGGDKAGWVAAELEAGDGALRRTLLLTVYVVPISAVAVIIALTDLA